ncbi:unnamed protein product [Trichogramma brassicae]|uniref:Uncharacterized protein n=1 Tax=Trichogramma brassicae TaxID=86971 RepID=A0A6H5IAU3_9HYME|nr:unnamed protein product [Trichogramma brassicae]
MGDMEAGNSQKTRSGGGRVLVYNIRHRRAPDTAPSRQACVHGRLRDQVRQTRNRITILRVYINFIHVLRSNTLPVARRVVWPLVSMMLLSYLGLSRAYQSPAAPLTDALMVLLLQRRLAAPRAAVGTSRSLCKQSSGVQQQQQQQQQHQHQQWSTYC